MADNEKSVDYDYLLRALALAKQYQGRCAPNPAVGAVLVLKNRVIGEGYHRGAGKPHAEVEALTGIDPKLDLSQATLYVTLEPCCHYGRTPPCTEKILSHKIGRVVFAYADPNPVVSGKGKKILETQGICCEQQMLVEVDAFYAPYAHFWRTGQAQLTAKIALSFFCSGR